MGGMGGMGGGMNPLMGSFQAGPGAMGAMAQAAMMNGGGMMGGGQLPGSLMMPPSMNSLGWGSYGMKQPPAVQMQAAAAPHMNQMSMMQGPPPMMMGQHSPQGGGYNGGNSPPLKLPPLHQKRHSSPGYTEAGSPDMSPDRRQRRAASSERENRNQGGGGGGGGGAAQWKLPPLKDGQFPHVQSKYAQSAANYVEQNKDKAKERIKTNKTKNKKPDRFEEGKRNAAMITDMANRWN